MNNKTATATAEANWEAAHTAWEQAKAYRMERWMTSGNILGHPDRAVNIAEDAMIRALRIKKAARIEAFLSAENAEINLNF